MKYYTGVGSRETPFGVQTLMTMIARRLDKEGWTLRTGDADGADEAFRKGTAIARVYSPMYVKSIYEGSLHSTTDASMATCAMDIAKSIHPNWGACNPFARWCHARNIFQVLGDDPRTPDPSKFLVCWTPNGEKCGGTRTAIVLAERYNVPVENLAFPETYEKWRSWACVYEGFPVALS